MKSVKIYIIVIILTISSICQVNGQFCFNDSDCINKNCVFFSCKPQGCRTDDDCVKWGHKNHFCNNNNLAFLGTQCIEKKPFGQPCLGANQCISNRCGWFLICA